MYGAWILHDGEVIDVIEECTHCEKYSYDEADDNGSIAVAFMNSRDNQFIMRFNCETVTNKALRECIRMVAKCKHDTFYISDIYSGAHPDFTQMAASKTEVVRYLRSLIKLQEKK